MSSELDLENIINKVLNSNLSSLNNIENERNDTINNIKNKQDDVHNIENKQPKNNNRCCAEGCRKKLTIFKFDCKCGSSTCIDHKYPDKHNCSFDYKEQYKKELTIKNPIVSASKIEKII